MSIEESSSWNGQDRRDTDRIAADIRRLEKDVHELTSDTIPELKITMADLRGQLSHLNQVITDFVTQAQFYPVKMIAYGLVSGVLVSVLAAVLSRVILK